MIMSRLNRVNAMNLVGQKLAQSNNFVYYFTLLYFTLLYFTLLYFTLLNNLYKIETKPSAYGALMPCVWTVSYIYNV